MEVALSATVATLRVFPEGSKTRKQDIHALLVENVRKLPFLRAIWILDSDGNMIYRSRLMKKLGVSDVASLVKFAIQHGITPLG